VAKKGGKREQSMMEKIANLLQMDPTEVKKAADQTYTEQEKILELQSVVHYYSWRKNLIKKPKESEAEFEARLKLWKYKICGFCELEFAYSYPYNSVEYCSLDCVKGSLEKLGLEFNYNRPLTQRWGYQRPAIVPSSALETVEVAVREHFSDESGYFEIDRPTRPTQDKPLNGHDTHKLQDTGWNQMTLDNMPLPRP